MSILPSIHPGGNPGAILETISHRCYLREVAFEWELTKEAIRLPLGWFWIIHEKWPIRGTHKDVCALDVRASQVDYCFYYALLRFY